jgi:hypothetical protein
MLNTFTLSTEAVTMTCSHDGCGIVYSVPKLWRDERRTDHATFYCPNGHQRWFPTGTSDMERAKAETEALQRRLEAARADAALHYDEKRAAMRRLSATQGVVTRTKRRVGHGVCPCCKRSFAALRQHMQTKHPDYAKEPA